jgi:hypothetical protein
MSGSSYVERPPSGFDCANVSFQTVLNSVDAAATVKKGDILDLRAKAPKGPLVAVNVANQEVGSITSKDLGKILSCMSEDNFNYIAEVLSIVGGEITVRVRPK